MIRFFPLFLIHVCLAVTLVMLLSIVLYAYQKSHEAFHFVELSHRITVLREQISYYDEVLTMSALMGAASQDPSWEKRYQEKEPFLSSAITQGRLYLKDLDETDSSMYLDSIDRANDALVVMEKRSFNLVREGHHVEALKLLQSNGYMAQKRIYAEGLMQLRHQLDRRAQQYIIDARHIEKQTIIAASVSILFSLLWWVVTAKVLHIWHKKGSIQAQEKQRALDQLTEANQELEAFSYVVSHDLKQPLRSIATFAQMVDQTFERGGVASHQETRTYLDYIRSSVSKLEQLIQDLLNYAQSGKADVKLRKLKLVEVFAEVQHALRSDISERGALILFKAQVTENDYVMMSWHDAQQLFQNMISNALKYGDSSRKPVITIDIVKDYKPTGKSFLHVTIADNGQGISEESLPNIFKPFFRGKTQVPTEGSGLGLAICHKIVNFYQGKIWVDSVAGEGAVFHLILPKVEAKVLDK